MGLLGMLVRIPLLLLFCWWAYDIRLYAIREYGMIIHELDPWFNYRAAEYLGAMGSERFFKWFDYMSWYPLGRPIGTTIYPGMQFASVWIVQMLEKLGMNITVNESCCMTPVWFGVVASLFTGLLAKEISGSCNVGLAATGVMSIIPAHLMRSVGGEYDNECVAVTFLVATFYLWCRSLRTERSWPIGALAGLAYFCMAASWGGFIFVTNMVALHAAAVLFTMVLGGNYSSYLHRAFSLYFIVGTALSVRIPVIGWTPLRSLEQLSATAVFLTLQVFEVCEIGRKLHGLGPQAVHKLRLKAFGVAALAGAILIAVVAPTGYFGPLSSRVRGLLVPHTRTGNPLVDSVSEHQPASPQAYWQMLYFGCWFAPPAFVYTVAKFVRNRVNGVEWMRESDRTNASLFLILHAMVIYHFSAKMNRLLLLMAPVTSVLMGIAMAQGLEWAFAQVSGVTTVQPEEDTERRAPSQRTARQDTKSGKGGRNRRSGRGEGNMFEKNFEPLIKLYNGNPAGRAVVGVVYIFFVLWCTWQLYEYSHQYSQNMSNPQIIFSTRDHQGNRVVVRDYIDGYHWLRDNTPKDSRVIAWWDYGYQITGIGNRTSIADGNTWNHEHIATLGRCLTSPVDRAHEKCVRHLADYVLVWAGGGHDDLSKSPHMARIGNSVYSDICPGDPLCTKFGFHAPRNPGQHYTQGDPTPMMANSLLYQVHSHGVRPGVKIDQSLFQEVYTSKYGKLRIFKVMNISQESKEWAADPANRNCDAPGSWYCPGQYPPAMQDWLKGRKAFRQLEDFNQDRDEQSDEYHKAYMQRMARGG